MEKCNIPFESLVDYVDGMTTPPETVRIDAHIAAGCSSCIDRLKTLRQATEVLREVFAFPATVPSDHARTFAKNLTRLRFPNIPATVPAEERAPSFSWSLGGVPRWIATLVQPETPLFAGTRSTADETPAQRVFETSDHLVTLWEEANTGNESSYVIGQVYSRQNNVCLTPELVLFTAQSGGATFIADKEDSEFHVPDLLAGDYVVHCWLNDNDVLALPRVRFGTV